MFGLGPVEIAGILIGGLVVDIGLLWVSTALLDTEVSWSRISLATLCAYVVFVGAAFGTYYATVSMMPSLPKNFLWALVGAFILGVALVLVIITGLIYWPMLAMAPSKGLWAGGIQFLLRLLLASLVVGVVAVVFAGIQIRRGAPRSTAAGPPPPALAVASRA